MHLPDSLTAPEIKKVNAKEDAFVHVAGRERGFQLKDVTVQKVMPDEAQA